MITLSRRQVRRLRAVFRRHALGYRHKGPVPPLVFVPDPDVGLRVRHHQPHLAVETVLRSVPGFPEPLCIPLDALADLEGSEDSPIVLEASSPTQTRARWEDRGIPQVKEYTVPEPASLPPFPEPPATFSSGPAPSLQDLAEAAATTDDDSTRYALGCLQFRGSSGEIIATDGRQILLQSGFRFPWEENLLVHRSALFSCRGLPRDLPVSLGKTDTHVALRVGDWTIWLGIRADARYPRIADVIPDERVPTIKLQLAAEDATFLDQALERLPGGEALYAPVTLDLNGQVSVRAQADRSSPVDRAGAGAFPLPGRARAGQHQPVLPGPRRPARVHRGPGPEPQRPHPLPGPQPRVSLAAVVEGLGDRADRRRHSHRVHHLRLGPEAGRPYPKENAS